jgi:deoxyribodipyrimidine photo-lyase
MTTILWFKRDLRVADHPALARAAAGGGAVLPLYVVEPEYWRLPDTSHRQWAFAAECLEELRAALGRLGAPLVVRVGDAVEVLESLRAAHGVTALVSHEETGNLWTFARDRRVAAWARERCVAWTELPQSGVVRRLASRDGWARARDGFVFGDRVAVPQGLKPVAVEPGAIPSAAGLGSSRTAAPRGRGAVGRRPNGSSGPF